MLSFLKVRLIGALPVLFGVVSLTFLLLHIVPGDPVDHLLGEYASAEDRAALRTNLGLDRPLPQQYAHFWKGVVTFDWGTSLARDEKVFPLILKRFPNTALLALLSLLTAIAIALPSAILSVRRRAGAIDRVSRFFSVASMSLPIFVVGPIAVLVFAIKLRILPVAGFDSWAGLLLPVLCLGVLSSGLLYKMLRSSLLDSFDEDYVRTARSKGLSERKILYAHVLKNAAIPVLTVIGNMLGGLLAGAVVTETIFDWPGIGRLFYSAFQSRDFPLIQGIVLWVALSYIAVNIVIDLILSKIDPRIRLEGDISP